MRLFFCLSHRALTFPLVSSRLNTHTDDLPGAKRSKTINYLLAAAAANVDDEVAAAEEFFFLPESYQLATGQVDASLTPIFDDEKFIYRGRSPLTPLGETLALMKSLFQKSVRKCDSSSDAAKYELAMMAMADMTYGVRLLDDRQRECLRFARNTHDARLNASLPEHERRHETVLSTDSGVQLARLKIEMAAIKRMFTNALNRLATVAVEDAAANPALVIALINAIYDWQFRSNAPNQYKLTRELFTRLMLLTYKLATSEKCRPSVWSHLYARGNEEQLRRMRPSQQVPPLDATVILTQERARDLVKARDERMFAYVMNSTVENKRALASAIANYYPTLDVVRSFYLLRVKSNAKDAHAFLAFMVFCVVHVDRFPGGGGGGGGKLGLTPIKFEDERDASLAALIENLWQGRYRLEQLPADSIVLDKHVKHTKDDDAADRFFRVHSWCSNASTKFPEYNQLQKLYVDSRAKADARCKKKKKEAAAAANKTADE